MFDWNSPDDSAGHGISPDTLSAACALLSPAAYLHLSIHPFAYLIILVLCTAYLVFFCEGACRSLAPSFAGTYVDVVDLWPMLLMPL